MSFSFGGTSVAQPAAPAPSGFSFGSAAPTTSSGFSFGAASTPAPAATGGGFSFGSSTGTASPSTAAPASSGFSFGGATGATSTAARSLFGGASPGATGAAPSSGFSFGAAPSTAGAAPAASSGFSFGAAPAATGGGSSFFGGGTAAPATGGGFFGSSSTTAAPSTGSGFFGAGSSAAPAAAGTSSVFGSNPALTSTPSSSFGFFGGGAAAAAPQLNGQGITLETAFEALPADVRKNIVEFHQVLKEEEQADAFLRTVSPRKLGELGANIARLDQEVLVRRNVQDRQATAVHHARRDTKHLIRQVDAAALSMRSLDGNSAANMYHIMRHVETPSPYYWELLDHYESKMQAIKAQIEDLESEYKPLYERRAPGGGAPSAAGATMTPALLHQVMVQQNASLMQVAARVAEVHERAEEMRQLFLITMRQDMARHGEPNPAAALRNPFEKRKKSAAEDKRETIDKIRFRTSVAPTIVAAPAAAPAAAQPATSGFGGFGAAAAAPAATPATATPSFFGATTGASAFGSTAAPAAAAAPTSSLFGSTAPAASAGAGSGGFSFGSSAAAPKQVSFNLGAAAPAAAAPAAAATSAFAVPSVATTGSAFGSSFLAGAAPGEAEKRAASSKRLGGRAKKRA